MQKGKKALIAHAIATVSAQTSPSPARSRNMRAIRSTGNTSTEKGVAAVLRHMRLSGWRRHYPLFGRPDFAWPKQRVAVFVDGCFWHGCPRHYTAPKANYEFWERKLATNQRRDAVVARRLRSEGWAVIRIRECQVKTHASYARLEKALNRPSRSGPRKG
jgi:DNA mismatch endonuclease (patch repair protein)